MATLVRNGRGHRTFGRHDLRPDRRLDPAVRRRRAARPDPHAPLRHAVVLVNPLSGSVGPRAAAEVEAIMADYDLKVQVVTLEGGGFDEAIAEAFAAKPDVIFVLAGDGTARSVASKARPDGPMIAPLPGGTMNMLPKALYGTADWKLALKRALEEGEAQPVSAARCRANISIAPPSWARPPYGRRRARPCGPAR